MRDPRSFLATVLMAAALAAPAWGASPPATPGKPTPADQRAGLDARYDVAQASRISDRRDAAGVGRLDGAELALLARQSYDPGPLLPPNQSAERTSAVSELDQARVDVLMTDARRARTAASAAGHAIGAERGTAR